MKARAPYMEWAKHRAKPAIDLAGSNLLACSLEDLPGAREALDISGESPNGYAPLVEAIAARYGVGPDNVATAVGCSGANFLTLAALVGPGDEVLLERPGYDPLAAAATMLGATVSHFDRRFEERYRLDPDAIGRAITSSTRVVVVSNPHNPSGVAATRPEMVEISRLAEKRGVTILADEVYRDLVRGGPPPAATLSACFVSTNSLTKAYGLASLRCGWALASPPIAEEIRRARDAVDVWSAIPADRLSVVAFRHLPALAERAQRLLARNAPLVAEFFDSRPELECVPSDATIAFPRFRDGRDAGPFVWRLFEEHGVAVAPGAFFDAPSHFRIAYAGAPEDVEKGLEAIAACL